MPVWKKTLKEDKEEKLFHNVQDSSKPWAENTEPHSITGFCKAFGDSLKVSRIGTEEILRD